MIFVGVGVAKRTESDDAIDAVKVLGSWQELRRVESDSAVQNLFVQAVITAQKQRALHSVQALLLLITCTA